MLRMQCKWKYIVYTTMPATHLAFLFTSADQSNDGSYDTLPEGTKRGEVAVSRYVMVRP